MMTRMIRPSVFLLAGIGAGLAASLIGRAWTTSLALSGGLFFSTALLVAILISCGTQPFRAHPVRYGIALLACVPAYIMVVFASASTTQFVAGTLHLAPTANLERGRVDMVVGVIVAACLAGFFIELLNVALVGGWSWRSLGCIDIFCKVEP